MQTKPSRRKWIVISVMVIVAIATPLLYKYWWPPTVQKRQVTRIAQQLGSTQQSQALEVGGNLACFDQCPYVTGRYLTSNLIQDLANKATRNLPIDGYQISQDLQCRGYVDYPDQAKGLVNGSNQLSCSIHFRDNHSDGYISYHLATIPSDIPLDHFAEEKIINPSASILASSADGVTVFIEKTNQ